MTETMKSAEDMVAEADTGARQAGSFATKLIFALCIIWSLFQLYIASKLPGVMAQTTLIEHEDKANPALVSPDGASVLAASDDRTAKIWSSTAGECLTGTPPPERAWRVSPCRRMPLAPTPKLCHLERPCFSTPGTGEGAAETHG